MHIRYFVLKVLITLMKQSSSLKTTPPSQIEDQLLDPILTISVVDGDPSVAPEPYAFLHLDLTYLPRGQPKEEWGVMEMIPGYEEPPPPTPVI